MHTSSGQGGLPDNGGIGDFMLRRFKGRIMYGLKTDRGLYRNINQDAVWAGVKDGLGLFVLSDGMGGHSRGELASNAITAAFAAYWQQLMQSEGKEFALLTQQIQQVILQVNQDIFLKYNQGQICGATLAVLLILGDCYAVFWAGDSRLYTLTGRKYRQLTTDDIWDLDPFVVRNYSAQEIAQNESSGKLVQAVGTAASLNIHVQTNRLQPGQAFLLCSDGMYKFCEEKWMKKGLRALRRKDSIEKVLKDLIDKVYDNGAGDNVSVILVRAL